MVAQSVEAFLLAEGVRCHLIAVGILEIEVLALMCQRAIVQRRLLWSYQHAVRNGLFLSRLAAGTLYVKVQRTVVCYDDRVDTALP